MALIQLREISKVYMLGEMKVDALREVSLDLERGEYVALMGPSGSGKLTLMNTLGCLDRPTSGSYVLDGEEVARLSRERARGFATGRSALCSKTSTCSRARRRWRTSSSPCSMTGAPPPIIAACAKEMLEHVGLSERMDHHPGQLSGGQQQRVAIAQRAGQQARDSHGRRADGQSRLADE